MPKALERKLRAQARKQGKTGKEADRYIYGTMVNQGWRPKRKRHGTGTNR